MEIKLTNVLYNFEEFYNRCNLYLRLETNVNDELELLYEQYMDIVELSLDNSFEPEKNVELSIEIIEFLLENFHYFKNDVFDYSLEQTLAICPNLVVVNYRQIYDKLIETYSLNEDKGFNNEYLSETGNKFIFSDMELEDEDDDSLQVVYCLDKTTNMEYSIFFIDGKHSHTYDSNGDNAIISDDFIQYLENFE